MAEPRAYTADEVRQQLLDHMRAISRYWAKQPDQTVAEKCDGLCFSILNIFDGTSMGLPAMDISLSPHEDDKEFNRSEGDNWYEPGQVINDCMMHEEWYIKKERLDAE